MQRSVLCAVLLAALFDGSQALERAAYEQRDLERELHSLEGQSKHTNELDSAKRRRHGKQSRLALAREMSATKLAKAQFKAASKEMMRYKDEMIRESTELNEDAKAIESLQTTRAMLTRRLLEETAVTRQAKEAIAEQASLRSQLAATQKLVMDEQRQLIQEKMQLNQDKLQLTQQKNADAKAVAGLKRELDATRESAKEQNDALITVSGELLHARKHLGEANNTTKALRAELRAEEQRFQDLQANMTKEQKSKVTEGSGLLSWLR